MTDLTSSTSVPAIVIFGTDEKGRPHASYFEQPDLTTAEKAASVMGMRSLITSSEDERALAAELPLGRLRLPQYFASSDQSPSAKTNVLSFIFCCGRVFISISLCI